MKKVVCFLFILLTVLLVIGCNAKTTHSETVKPTSNQMASTAKSTKEENQNKIVDEPHQNGDFKVTMLDVGQGLSVLIEADGHAMVYDGGNRDNSSYVVSYLKKHKITNIDYIIASHYDEDHIAGLIGILKTASVDTAIIPSYVKDTKIYKSFISAIQSANTVVYAKAGSKYKLGKAVIDILYASAGSEETENNMSTVIKVSYGSISCVLTGDAEFETEDYLVQSGAPLKSTLYIVGHHGSSHSSSDVFIKAMQPELAFISVGLDNAYGHPTDKTITTLTKNNVTIYRTDKQGEIVLSYDGSSYKVTTVRRLEERLEGDVKYVINISSMRFHLPECESASKMAIYNKKLSSKSREELIQEGYKPCGACKP